MNKELVDLLINLPPTTVVDLLMTANGLKTGSEICRGSDKAMEGLMAKLGLVFRQEGRCYIIARNEKDLEKRGTDSISRGRWFGIPECCIQNYQGKDKEELRKRLSLEEVKILDKGESVPDEFYLGSMGYIPHSMKCQATLERGMKTRKILDGVDPRLWAKFRNFHIRRRLAEYGGEIKSWREK
ncbi:MAG: hypothetical protein AB1305_04615 [Candidatus Hadarchaeota archaeon]